MRINQIISHVHLSKARPVSAPQQETVKKSSGVLRTGWFRKAKTLALALGLAAGLGTLSACAPYQYYDPNARALGGAAIGALACPDAPLACGAIGAGIGALTTPEPPPVIIQQPVYFPPYRPPVCYPNWYTGLPVCY